MSMSGFLEIAWIAGFGGMLVWLVRAVATARRRGSAVVGRTRAAIAAVCVAVLGLGSAYVWGIDFAQRGMQRILADRDGGDTAFASPARARLFLRHVQLVLEPTGAVDDPDDAVHEAVVGYSPDATLRLPRGYELAESTRGWNVLRVRASGPQGLAVSTIENIEDTGTRVMLFRARRGSAAPAAPEQIERKALALVGKGERRCRVPDGDPGEVSLDGPGAIYAVLCIGRAPRAALVFERDLDTTAGASTAPVRLTPLVWAGSKWRPHHVQISSGSLIQIGALTDALPGVTLWEVPAPAARAELFYPPKNLHASCSEWLDSQQMSDRGYVSAPLGDIAPPEVGHDDDPICVLPFTAPFGLEVRRLLPDMPSIAARSLWAAGLLVTPALFLLFFLCAQARSRVTAQRFARTLALSWLSVFLAAIGVWRLLWSHRIDMLRDYESVGPRVLQNQVLLALAGAALAATAVLCWQPIRKPAERIGAAVIAWVTWLVLGGYALRGDFAALDLGGRVIAQVVLSLAIGTAAGWIPLVERVVLGEGRARWTALSERLNVPPDVRAWIAAMIALAALALAALIAKQMFPRAVALKLGLAWALVLLFYASIRACFSPEGMAVARALATFALAGVAAVTQASFDPGVTAAIAFPGMVLAILFASHDARYGEESVRQIASYRRHHAPLVIAHAAVVALLGAGIAIWAITGLRSAGDNESDAVLAETLTYAAIHGVALLALLFIPAAAVAFRRRGLRAAIPWLFASAVLLGMWTARGPALDRTLGSQSQAANRIAIVVDPGYALLRSETKFLAGITAWRETIIPTPEHTPPTTDQLIDGQGYFGAQLIDPGVLLSVENDYFPVLLLRETGIRGLLMVAIVLLMLVAGLWLVSGDRFRHGSAPQRMRGLIAVVLAILCIYQPLASLGVLPLTGIAWPGLGLDSPTDFWLLVALSLWILVWGNRRKGEEKLDEFDADLRRSTLFRRVRAGIGAAAALLTIAGLLLLSRASAFALRRPNPIDAEGRAVAPFAGLQHAIDYTRQLRCPRERNDSADPASIVPEDLLADPLQAGVRRFHTSMVDAWDRNRPTAVDHVGRFLSGDDAACPVQGTASGRWWFERAPDDARECRAVFKAGWPEVHITVQRRDAGEVRSRCTADAGAEVLKRLRIPLRRPYENARVRLVSRAMGKAATDRGELVSGHLTVRLRPGAGEVDVADATAGLYHGETVHISPELSIEIAADAAVLRHSATEPPAAEDETLLFVRDNARAPVHVLEADEGRWRLLPPGTNEIPLDHMALVVVGGSHARSLWLFRPPTTWGDAGIDATPAVDTLLADDVSTVRGERRRHYLYGSLLPEVGWVNPFHSRSSLGLDGWVHVAMSEYENTTSWPSEEFNAGFCGTLAPPRSESLAPVCARSPLDGVLECRVSVQPELAIRLRHLTELLALRPERFENPSKKKKKPTPDELSLRPVRANFALLRGDTGEIVAQGELVPGRASSAYAPATPELEQHLIRLREDRDPDTGRKLSRARRGEASAEKIEWAQPVAVGSTMKPLLGRALELADPAFARALVLEGDKFRGARCGGGKAHAILGHCPPTDTLWERAGNYASVDMNIFVSHSLNWYQAAIGLLGTAVPRGTWGFGDEVGEGSPLQTKNVGDHSTSAALWTKHKNKTVLSDKQRLTLAILRETPMWSRFEALVGRPLCTAGNKTLCRRNTARRDICAARALPIDNPTRDLRHLVALGPSTFDFYPELRDDTKTVGNVNTREYLQFLRGSGLHPLGSLAQLTDAFNRLVFQGDHDPAAGGYTLAASWFPLSTAPGTLPPDCAGNRSAPTVHSGLCNTLLNGTATRDLGDILDDPRLVFYGAKTGTIDSLGEIAENPEACERFNTGHTVPGNELDAAHQPYWIECEESGKRAQNKINDTLFVISFGVKTRDGIVPLTLGLRFQRSGIGFTTRAARHYIDVIRDYFE